MKPHYRRPLLPKTYLHLPLLQATLKNAHTQDLRILGLHRSVTTDFVSRNDNRQMQFFVFWSITPTNVLEIRLKCNGTR